MELVSLFHVSLTLVLFLSEQYWLAQWGYQRLNLIKITLLKVILTIESISILYLKDH